MMSEMEKNAQIGELVKQRQDRKIALEHLKLKGDKIAAAYSAFGSAQVRWCVDDATGRGSVLLSNPRLQDREHPRYLLGPTELADHIREVTVAEQALAATSAQLSSLGITD
jgi:hypothetical protein